MRTELWAKAVLFFFPVKIKFPSVKIFRFLPVKIWNAREKILKSAREIGEMQKVTVKIFLKSHAWKNCWCTWKFLLIYPVKTITKPNFYVRENKNHTREKRLKSVRENTNCAWKSVREKIFPSVKKTEKGPKMAFTGTFDFHGKKKNTAAHVTALFSF